MSQWSLWQLNDVVDRFRDSRECSSEIWDEIVISFAILLERGPNAAGASVAKKLVNGDGIWELIARLGNRQPRLLFYRRPGTSMLIFVHAFMKTGGNKDYGPATKLAQKRRAAVEQRGATLAAINRSTLVN
jgi:hypothetical protein